MPAESFMCTHVPGKEFFSLSAKFNITKSGDAWFSLDSYKTHLYPFAKQNKKKNNPLTKMNTSAFYK